MVPSSWPGESSPGSFDECRLSAGWPSTLRPSQLTWAFESVDKWLLPSTSTIAICYFDSSWKLILVLPSHGLWKAESTLELQEGCAACVQGCTSQWLSWWTTARGLSHHRMGVRKSIRPVKWLSSVSNVRFEDKPDIAVAMHYGLLWYIHFYPLMNTRPTMEGKHPACRVVSSMASCMPKNCIVVKKHFTQTDTH